MAVSVQFFEEFVELSGEIDFGAPKWMKAPFAGSSLKSPARQKWPAQLSELLIQALAKLADAIGEPSV